ncbi:hypothetical protein [uncultured Winogradskyella sp.]|uniref:hypothetical protein n=1 Tax=uncultured Winogradskyella sp. TaxID=395353 RepID=UPI0030EE276A|tara:strand:- start:914 stop:1612 length:699 start_codon:yes stop_codon:yes gene_type:complete
MNFNDLITHLIELVAALGGSYYYLKTKDYKIKPFIWYLWFIVFIETFALYSYTMLYNYDNSLFNWIKNSVFCTNSWLFNLYSLVSILILSKFYLGIINDVLSKKIINILTLCYFVFAIFYHIFSGDFFVLSIPYDIFFETLLVFAFVMLYYKQLLKSDKVLSFYKLPVFYLSSGLLLWYLVVTPLFIFDEYFYALNSAFVEFRVNYLLFSNISLYTCYTFGFLYTLQFYKKL